MDLADAAAPDTEEIARLARAAFDGLPEAFRARCEGLAIRVAEFADDETLDAMEIEDPWELTGLYDGVPLTEKSVLDVMVQPDTVWLFRQPILLEWIERGEVTLGDLVGHVLVHEIAHHFGMSDDEIAAIDDWRL